MVISSLSVRGHVHTHGESSSVSNQRLYLLNKLKHAGLSEKSLANIFQAISMSGMPC